MSLSMCHCVSGHSYHYYTMYVCHYISLLCCYVSVQYTLLCLITTQYVLILHTTSYYCAMYVTVSHYYTNISCYYAMYVTVSHYYTNISCYYAMYVTVSHYYTKIFHATMQCMSLCLTTTSCYYAGSWKEVCEAIQ